MARNGAVRKTLASLYSLDAEVEVRPEVRRMVSGLSLEEGHILVDANDVRYVVSADNALMLARHGAAVTLIHRRDTMRAQKRTVEALCEEGVTLLLGWYVSAIRGSGDCVTVLGT